MTTGLDDAIRIKICGFTSRRELDVAVASGADAVGLVFYPPSPRAVTISQAETLTAGLPPFITVTGLFVNASRDEIAETCARCRIDLIQLHGDETPDDCLGLPRPVIKAARVKSENDLDGLEDYPVSGLLLDAKAKGLYGGSGEAFDWSLLESYAPPRPLILAGGLNPDNVVTAIKQVRPYAVDVSSGVESSPGVKDAEKVREFIKRVQQTKISRVESL